MSNFKEKLNKLFIQEFGEEALKNCIYLKNNNYLKTDSSINYDKYLNHNNRSFSNKISNNSNYKSTSPKKLCSSRSIYQKNFANNIMNKSILSPMYSDKDSFICLTSNDGLKNLRENSRNKYKSKLRKEIDGLTNVFNKEKESAKYRRNRPIRLNFSNNFKINYLTTLSNFKKNEKKRNKYDEKKYFNYWDSKKK